MTDDEKQEDGRELGLDDLEGASGGLIIEPDAGGVVDPSTGQVKFNPVEPA